MLDMATLPSSTRDGLTVTDNGDDTLTISGFGETRVIPVRTLKHGARTACVLVTVKRQHGTKEMPAAAVFNTNERGWYLAMVSNERGLGYVPLSFLNP